MLERIANSTFTDAMSFRSGVTRIVTTFKADRQVVVY